jgi:hypothetical protein
MHLTVCVSMIPSRCVERRPAAPPPRTARGRTGRVPASEPAMHRAPRRHMRRQGPPRATNAQMQGDCPHNRERGRGRCTARRISLFRPTCHLLFGTVRYHSLQTRLMPRPMLFRPHPVSPPCLADLIFNYRDERGIEEGGCTQTGSQAHPFQGDAVSPILSDDGSINKVWIGMAGCLGSV